MVLGTASEPEIDHRLELAEDPEIPPIEPEAAPAPARDRGPWTQTFTGRRFYTLNPRIEDICILDIAHHLSNVCRFGGACKKFLSVAEHSVKVSLHVSPENARSALLHDASEAYLGDMQRPLKRYSRFSIEYVKVEEWLQHLIAIKYRVPTTMPEEVRRVDTEMLYREREAVMTRAFAWEFDNVVEPTPCSIDCWDPEIAKEMFLRRWEELGGRRSD